MATTARPEALLDRLRRAADTRTDVVVTGEQADMIVDVLDIIRQVKYDANAAIVLAGTALARFKDAK